MQLAKVIGLLLSFISHSDYIEKTPGFHVRIQDVWLRVEAVWTVSLGPALYCTFFQISSHAQASSSDCLLKTVTPLKVSIGFWFNKLGTRIKGLPSLSFECWSSVSEGQTAANNSWVYFRWLLQLNFSAMIITSHAVLCMFLPVRLSLNPPFCYRKFWAKATHTHSLFQFSPW